jgi:PKHD-type hydroxylase
MILCMAEVLTSDELNWLVSELKDATFIDGKLTAGWHARLVKHNTQLKDDGSTRLQEVRALISQALKRHALFQMAVLPKAIRPILLSRYEAGMAYGSHIDNAVMGEQERVRSDISLTLFLNGPETYTGGELVIESTQGEQAFKLAAGSMIVYPSSTLHRVEPVSQGVRLVAVTWVQSLVRDPSKREILFDLDTVRHTLFQKEGKTREFDLISKSHANLLRQWAEV